MFNFFKQLKKYDRELDDLQEILAEYPIYFPPTYPFEEDPEMPTDYMSTRCPSWCDRILLSLMAKEIIDNESDIDNVNNKNPYSVIGQNVCMGDHKVYIIQFLIMFYYAQCPHYFSHYCIFNTGIVDHIH